MLDTARHPIDIFDRDREAYQATFQLQQQLVDEKLRERTASEKLILVEHDNIYTVGRGVPFQSPEEPSGERVPWIETNRGGQATFHGPGQLVAYPVFDLERHGKDVHLFLRMLERALIACLADFEIEGFARDGLTGVWVDLDGAPRKIASIGIGVRRWVSYHGIGLNVRTDLRYFRAISACDQRGAVMTSMDEVIRMRRGQRAKYYAPGMSAVKASLVDALCEVFALERVYPRRIDKRRERPDWIKVRAPGSPQFQETTSVVRENRLVTVCEEAMCPNISECWTHSTATFMIMGELCTRRCSFCSVQDGTVGSLNPLDPFEPLRVATAIEQLGLKHVVITSVNRDDLPDMGAEHFHRTVVAIHRKVPSCAIELLIPDQSGKRERLEVILSSGQVSVLNHNLETVPRLYRRVRPGAKIDRSLSILLWARELQPNLKTKSGIMVGLGETKDEVLRVMDMLREVDCSILTIGQYLQPTAEQLPVERYVRPDEFDAYREEGLRRGFSHVESGPFVRSSYHAWKHVTSDDTAAPVASIL